MRGRNEISELWHAKNETIFITKNGYGDLVVMSIEAYECMQDDYAIDREIELSEEEYAESGIAYDAKEALLSLRRKHFG